MILREGAEVMHVVVWKTAGERYAIESRVVVEVIPVVEPRRVTQAPDWLSGMINYRGDLTPVLDLRSMLGLGPTERRRGSRILIVQVPAAEGGAMTRVGLLAETVEGAGHHDFAGDGAIHGLSGADAPHLGPTALTDGITVQLIRVESLLRDEHHAVLFEEASAAQEPDS
jgi:chemotaxis-related protein WspB